MSYLCCSLAYIYDYIIHYYYICISDVCMFRHSVAVCAGISYLNEISHTLVRIPLKTSRHYV